MKIGKWIGTGIFLSIVGIGLTVVASTQLDFDHEIKRTFMDPTLEEKNYKLEEIKSLTYTGSADTIKICHTEEESTFQYYEGKYITYNIEYDEATQSLSIEENYKSHFGFSWKETNVLYISSPLEDVKINVSAGNVIIENMTMENLEADVSCGNLEIHNSLGTTAKLSANAGNMNIKNSTFDDLTLRVNTGNLNFLGDIMLLGKIKVDVGNMSLKFKQNQGFYTINGQGDGSSIIVYELALGNSSISYENE